MTLRRERSGPQIAILGCAVSLIASIGDLVGGTEAGPSPSVFWIRPCKRGFVAAGHCNDSSALRETRWPVRRPVMGRRSMNGPRCRINGAGDPVRPVVPGTQDCGRVRPGRDAAGVGDGRRGRTDLVTAFGGHVGVAAGATQTL